MKAYTTIEQSKKLANILPIDSADMCWVIDDDIMKYGGKPYLNPYKNYIAKEYYTPCWSLATLLDYLSPNFLIDIKNINYKWKLDCRFQVIEEEELVDACYEMIIKLHEQKVL